MREIVVRQKPIACVVLLTDTSNRKTSTDTVCSNNDDQVAINCSQAMQPLAILHTYANQQLRRSCNKVPAHS